MTRSAWMRSIGFLCLGLCLLALTHRAAAYEYRVFEPSAPGYERINPISVNAHGVVSGSAVPIGGDYWDAIPVLWHPGGGVTPLAIPDDLYPSQSATAYLVTNDGYAIGLYLDNAGYQKPVLWAPDGGIIPNPFPVSGTDFYFAGINNANQLIARFSDDQRVWPYEPDNIASYRWSPGTGAQTLIEAGDANDHYWVSALNDRGDILLTTYTLRGDQTVAAYARLDADGTITPIGTEDDLGIHGAMYHINNQRTLAGQRTILDPATNTRVTEAALWTEDGQVVSLGNLGRDWAQSRSINNAGVVVGEATTYLEFEIEPGGQIVLDQDQSAFIWDAEHGMRELTGLVDLSAFGEGWFVSHASQVTDTCQIIAVISGPAEELDEHSVWVNRPTQTVILTPVPEPTSAIALGVGVLCLWRRRRGV